MLTPLQIQERVDAHTLAAAKEERRTYLGASVIGDKCVRKLWYDFRWVGRQQWEPRMLRLFQRGHREEPVIHDLLKGAGFIVRTPQSEGEEMFQFKDLEGHFAGTADGAIAEGDHAEWLESKYDPETLEWFCLSCKTYGVERFKELKRLGVKESDPKYYFQEISYMGEIGFDWTLFFAVAKDTDEIYTEWIPFNRQDFEVCLSKAEQIINASTPPERISNDPKTFSCRYCNYNLTCHANQPIKIENRHCRNCSHSSPAAAGTWECHAGESFGKLCEKYQPVTGGRAASA